MHRIIQKLFWVPNYFTIAIRRKNNPADNIIHNRRFVSEIELPSRPDYWIADPMLIQNEERTYLFYEACVKGKGRIECREIGDNQAVSDPVVVLEKEYHISYPFVFSFGGTWYMIPETSAIGKVQIYRAVDFPCKWEFFQTILDGNAVDTTVFPLGDKLLMLTFLANGITEEVVPKAFCLRIEKDSVFSENLSWPEHDPLCSRGAGPMLYHQTMLIRPSQMNDIHSYGNGLIFHEVFLENDRYHERERFRVLQGDVVFRRYPFNGLHTYTCSDQYEAIDVRCSFFDLCKPMKKIISRLK